jgi:hypothetical protein
MEIFISSDDMEECVVIKEKTPRSCYSQFMAKLLVLQHPEKQVITVYASKEQNKHQLESTLKNMNFQFYTVYLQ